MITNNAELAEIVYKLMKVQPQKAVRKEVRSLSYSKAIEIARTANGDRPVYLGQAMRAAWDHGIQPAVIEQDLIELGVYKK